MAEKRKRGQNFTTLEKEKLINLLMDQKETILNKKTDGCTNEAKCIAWMEVTNSFNANATVHRTKDSLMKVWEKLKSECKLYHNATQRSLSQTGGGPSIIKIDPIMEQVSSIMGRGCTGIEGVNDSDAQQDIIENMCSEVNNYPKVIFVEDAEEIQINPSEARKTLKDAVENKKIPLWSRRRPVTSKTNEKGEAIQTICESFQNMNKKKEDVENLKYLLLKEELEAKQKQNELQLQTMEKELIIKDIEIEIKKTILEQVKGGGLAVQNQYSVFKKN